MQSRPAGLLRPCVLPSLENLKSGSLAVSRGGVDFRDEVFEKTLAGVWQSGMKEAVYEVLCEQTVRSVNKGALHYELHADEFSARSHQDIEKAEIVKLVACGTESNEFAGFLGSTIRFGHMKPSKESGFAGRLECVSHRAKGMSVVRLGFEDHR